jgi:preprotein translocase subunit Sec63
MTPHTSPINRYKQLLNEVLPATFTQPVRNNHCFNRIVLDWLFADVWYNHLDRSKTAISQLSNEQLLKMINRMEQWLQQPQLLFEDNLQSLIYRKKSIKFNN